MAFIVLFGDNANADPDIRRTHMVAHLSFLEANGATVIAAGPLAEPAGAAAGGLWLVEAEDAADVEQLVRDDPFWPTGLRKSFTILKWT